MRFLVADPGNKRKRPRVGGGAKKAGGLDTRRRTTQVSASLGRVFSSLRNSWSNNWLKRLNRSRFGNGPALRKSGRGRNKKKDLALLGPEKDFSGSKPPDTRKGKGFFRGGLWAKSSW